MPQFRLKAGQHIQGGITYRPIEGHNIVESDRDLVKKFGHDKFELILPAEYYQQHAPQAAAGAVAVAEPPKAQVAAKAAPTPPPGAEVTEAWPQAVELGLRVFKKPGKGGSRFFITERDMPDRPLNDEPLTKDDVQAYLDDNS